ncbi:MAG TPA: hypothetical protein VE130_16895 [Nitrososphaeraceae archaeon]|jgi:hypothetical protein|nr:hypothetical protein [Nitrososphaeraceae archaeon]
MKKILAFSGMITVLMLSAVIAPSASSVVNGLPTFKTQQDKRFNEIVNSQVAPELRPLTQNLTDKQQGMLALVLTIGKEQITTEERLTDIITGVNETRDPKVEAQDLVKHSSHVCGSGSGGVVGG